MNQNEFLHLQYANVNFDALKRLNIKWSEYGFCFTAEQYQKTTGWVECGVHNTFNYPYPLKMSIGERCNFLERKTNRLFHRLREKGFIEVSEDKQRFRITDKFRVFKPTVIDEAAREREIEERYKSTGQDLTTLGAKKIPFSASPYINDYDVFKADMQTLNIRDLDFEHYHNTLTHYYSVENPHIVYVDWFRRCVKWIEQDTRKGVLVKVKVKKEKENLDPICKLNDIDLSKELELFYDKVVNPETDSFEEYKETAETFMDFAKEALKRGDRVLKDRGKENVKAVMHHIKHQLPTLWETQRKKDQPKPINPMPDIANLANEMKNKSG